jgi:hypothetical protein
VHPTNRPRADERPAAPSIARPPGGEVVLLTADGATVQAVQDAAAAAGVAVRVAAHWRAGEPGERLLAVLVGTDVAEELLGRGLPTGAPVLLVGPDSEAAPLWRLTGALGAAAAAPLPSAGAWLVQWLLERAGPVPSPAGTVVAAVFSACGGAGASTLTAALAVRAAEAGAAPLVVDADPGPAGIELLLADTGPLWPDDSLAAWPRFAGTRGFLAPDALGGLPVLQGVTCLGWGGLPDRADHGQWRGALVSVCAAAGLAHRLVLLDCGPALDVAAALPAAARPVLVVPGSVRGLVAGRAALAELRGAFAAEVVVVLRDAGGARTPAGCEAELGSPGVWWDFDAQLALDEEVGRPPGTRGRSATAKAGRAVLARVARSRRP